MCLVLKVAGVHVENLTRKNKRLRAWPVIFMIVKLLVDQSVNTEDRPMSSLLW